MRAPLQRLAAALVAVLCVVACADAAGPKEGRGRFFEMEHVVKEAKAAAQVHRAAEASTASVVPGPVTNFALEPVVQTVVQPANARAQMNLYWDPPALFGAFVTAYRVYLDGILMETTVLTGASLATLTPGRAYTFSVTAVSSAGEGLPTALSAIAQVQPSAPRNVLAVPGDGTIDVFWSPPSFTGGAPVDGYLVKLDPPMLLNCVPTSATSCRFTGVQNFQAYAVYVYAQHLTPNPITSAEPGVGEAMPRPLPSGPRNFRIVRAGPTFVVLAWDAPQNVDPAAPIQGYQLSTFTESEPQGLYQGRQISAVFPLVRVVPATPTEVVITDLVPGNQYRFGVSSYTSSGVGGMTANPIGSGPDGVYTTPVGLAPPNPPANLVVVDTGSGSAWIQWSVPDTASGPPVTKYRITIYKNSSARKLILGKGGSSKLCSAKNCPDGYLVKGLPIGTSAITVAAKNKLGWGPESDPVEVTTVEKTSKNGGILDNKTSKPKWNANRTAA